MNDFKQQPIISLAEKSIQLIRNLAQVGLALSAEKDLHNIFDLILDVAIQFTNADGGTFYRVIEDGQKLEFELMFNRSLNLRLGGSHGELNWPKLHLYTREGAPRMDHFIAETYHSGRELIFDDVYQSKGYDLSGTIKTDKTYGYRCKSMLLIPLKNHEDEVLGIVQMINALDEVGNVVSFSEEQRIIMASLASQAAISLSNHNLIDSLETLLLQFMQAIATGIERKSKYSSEHIHRVAEFTDMIAGRINAAGSGAFAGVNFSQEELRELSMAGLMHDVGKIVTPVTILDKSVKLESFRDGIETVELRFREIQLVLRLMAYELSEAKLQDLLRESFITSTSAEQACAWLDGELDFLRQVNIEEKHLTDEEHRRIEILAGIHLHHSGRDYFLLSAGEKANLQILRGTLNTEELQRMNDHVSLTWDMLSQLNFPRKYKNVAFYAATHHEKLNGTGYPFGLSEDGLPLQSRILAIADIFEAVTSNNRPYKKPHNLSGSLRVLAIGVLRGELDKDVLDFVLDSGLYLEYAHKYMNPEQIDAVDIEAVKAIYFC